MAFHITASHPEGLGAVQTIQEAMAEAGIIPDQVGYINAHATSSPVGDISECKAISQVFESSLDRLHVSATKSKAGKPDDTLYKQLVFALKYEGVNLLILKSYLKY